MPLTVIAAMVLPSQRAPALFVIAAATMLLLFMGIHNAWDTVTFIVVQRKSGSTKAEAQS